MVLALRHSQFADKSSYSSSPWNLELGNQVPIINVEQEEENLGKGILGRHLGVRERIGEDPFSNPLNQSISTESRTQDV
ncbi:hypothetical protein BOTCAL_0028g00150 [Botryotinia calthae]|uniref:Uncharacterized protein n=1 Tax=Botryotinia calthae TaxID=38488 RepID=A0A4Y8DE17_9HELO|nr:hypothetical protein BOTCAL_0028g00150 [Botryotinia calthae]